MIRRIGDTFTKFRYGLELVPLAGNSKYERAPAPALGTFSTSLGLPRVVYETYTVYTITAQHARRAYTWTMEDDHEINVDANFSRKRTKLSTTGVFRRATHNIPTITPSNSLLKREAGSTPSSHADHAAAVPPIIPMLADEHVDAKVSPGDSCGSMTATSMEQVFKRFSEMLEKFLAKFEAKIEAKIEASRLASMASIDAVMRAIAASRAPPARAPPARAPPARAPPARAPPARAPRDGQGPKDVNDAIRAEDWAKAAEHIVKNNTKQCELFVSYCLNTQECGYLGTSSRGRGRGRGKRLLDRSLFMLELFASRLCDSGMAGTCPSTASPSSSSSSAISNARTNVHRAIMDELNEMAAAAVTAFAQGFHGTKDQDLNGSLSGMYRDSRLRSALLARRRSNDLVTEGDDERAFVGVSRVGQTGHRAPSYVIHPELWLFGEDGDRIGSEEFIALAHAMSRFCFPERFDFGTRPSGLHPAVVRMTPQAIALLMWFVNNSEVRSHGNMNDRDKREQTARKRYGASVWSASIEYRYFLQHVKEYVAEGRDNGDGRYNRLLLLEKSQVDVMYRDMGLDLSFLPAELHLLDQPSILQ